MSAAPSADALSVGTAARYEVFAMSINRTTDQAQNILEALRKIQDTPELKAQAATNPQSVINKLGLSGTARRAVSVALLTMAVAPVSMGLEGFWS
jgi:hypothetical protein